MSYFLALGLIALLLGAPSSAHACSLLPPDAEATFERSDSVVLARPIEITPEPSEARKDDGEDFYKQNVTWLVLYIWKGGFTQEDRFVTTNVIRTHDPCAGWDVIRDYQPRLVYLSGESPFASYYSIELAGAFQFLRSLQGKDRSDGG